MAMLNQASGYSLVIRARRGVVARALLGAEATRLTSTGPNGLPRGPKVFRAKVSCSEI
jgi:hypothetical protein